MKDLVVEKFNGYSKDRGLHSLVWKDGRMYSMILPGKFTEGYHPSLIHKVTIHTYSNMTRMDFDSICQRGESYFWDWFKKNRKGTRIFSMTNIGQGTPYEPIEEIVERL